VSKAHVWELEKGRSANPSFDLVQKLARYFGVTPDELTGEAVAPTPVDQQIQRIHRDLKDLTTRDRNLIEQMVRSMHASRASEGDDP
jgi:transcriptional regulator with XRE-family HTH domain